MLSEWSQTCLDARVKTNETLGDLLEPALKLRPDKIAIHYDDRAITYRELDAVSNRVANALVAAGIRPGDRICLHIDNRPEFIFIFYGAMRVGAVVVPANVMYTPDELDHILTDSGARLFFVLNALAEKWPKITAPLIEKVIEVGSKLLPNSLSLDEFTAGHASDRPKVAVDSAKVCVIQYTSGTTGQPKGAMVSHVNILAVLENTTDLPGALEGIEEDGTLIVLPLFHSYALNLGINRTFSAVQTMVLVNRFDAVRIFELFQKHKVTIFYGAPPMYFAFINTPGLDKFDVSSLRGAYSGAAPLPVVVLEKFKELTGVMIMEGYGLSETAPTLSTNAAGPVNKPGAVGPPIKQVQLRIVDENDNDVPPGGVGEVIARGPNIFLGYWNRPEETAEAMRGGWFHTGDMGRFDEDGYLYIVDRKKDMIVVSGYNVYPIELENVIMRHPKIMDCAVIGVPSEYQGESVKAVLVAKPGADPTAEEIEAYCREHMANFKVPKYYVFRDSLPKNATGKVLKRVIRDQEGGITKAKV